MPDFRMWDPWVTREMTIRDLLVHRSGLGLGEGDLLFLPNSTLSRKETVRRIRYLKPATSFRSGYAYDNILYMAAGQLIEEVSGETWEQYIHNHVFGPLGMNHSTDTDAEFHANPNHARPHSRSGGAIHGLGTQTPLDEDATIAQNAAPGGRPGDQRQRHEPLAPDAARPRQDPGQRQAAVLRRTVAADVDRRRDHADPAIIPPSSPSPSRISTSTLWAGTCRIIAARKVVGHDGAVLGSQATVALLPEKNIGIFIAANSEDGEIILGLRDELLDHYLGYPQSQWPEKFHNFKIGAAERGGEAGADRRGEARARSGRRFRSTAMPASIPTPGTARSRSARRARA